MKLILATNNAHKVTEMKAILAPYFDDILSMREAGIDHETVEDGETFMENAVKKARELAEISGCCAIADDSGLCVDALGGAPGVYSARFCGHHGDDEANNEKLIAELKARGLAESKAAYRCVLSFVGTDGRELTASGSCEGVVREPRRGENGFGYDPYFYVTEGKLSGRTMAQLTLEEKGTISHRARAMEKLKKMLEENAL